MAFEQESSKVPTSIGKIKIVLEDSVGPVEQVVSASIEILGADGQLIKTWRGLLDGVVAPGIITSLTAQMTALRTQAASELLP